MLRTKTLRRRLKALAVAGFHRTGWEISRHGLVKAATAEGGYLPCPPNRYLTLAAWLAPEFQQRYDAIRAFTAVSADRCYILEQFARHCSHLSGDFAECGVLKGGTAMLLADVLRDEAATERQLHLFDTFEGMPESAGGDPSGHRAGDFGNTSIAEVQERLRPFSNVVFHPGTIPETLAAADGSFAFVHIDVDLYQSTRDCLEFFYPRVVPGGILVCDDYGFPLYELAARRAVDEFFEQRTERVTSLRSGQCFVIKLLASS